MHIHYRANSLQKNSLLAAVKVKEKKMLVNFHKHFLAAFLYAAVGASLCPKRFLITHTDVIKFEQCFSDRF